MEDKQAQITDVLRRALEFAEQGKEIPADWAKVIFPSKKREYELSYYNKQTEEQTLADVDPVPLQEVSSFNTPSDYHDWQNKLIFGDNLQVLKRLVEMKKSGELKNADGTDGVRLVYIDPPFSTRKDFKAGGDVNQKAYQDKVAGAEFLEWLRRRLILLRELLADNGSIYVHLDYRRVHYVKILMDEIFGEHNFKNEIIWNFIKGASSASSFGRKHQTIFLYGNGNNIFNLDDVRIEYSPETIARAKRGEARYQNVDVETLELKGKNPGDVWADIFPVQGNSIQNTDYPTQKPESLLERIIKASSNNGDIVLDCFSGSGTTPVVAEKLGRRWISCDVGKLSIYTQQKRLLALDPKPKFALYNAGLYDFEKMRELSRDDWRLFALQLFSCIDEPHKIKGFSFDGKREGQSVWIYNFHDNDALITAGTIDDLHARVGASVNGDVFIIAPKGSFEFMEDYIEKDGTRYYSLRIPYSFIAELHKRKFTTIDQPRNSEDVNDGIEAVGFDFIQLPDIEFDISGNRLHIKQFEGKTRNRGLDETHGWDSFSMLLIDYDYDGKVFDLDEVKYAKDFNNQTIDFASDKIKNCAMLIFLDKFGNEVRVIKDKEDIQ